MEEQKSFVLKITQNHEISFESKETSQFPKKSIWIYIFSNKDISIWPLNWKKQWVKKTINLNLRFQRGFLEWDILASVELSSYLLDNLSETSRNLSPFSFLLAWPWTGPLNSISICVHFMVWWWDLKWPIYLSIEAFSYFTIWSRQKLNLSSFTIWAHCKLYIVSLNCSHLGVTKS